MEENKMLTYKLQVQHQTKILDKIIILYSLEQQNISFKWGINA